MMGILMRADQLKAELVRPVLLPSKLISGPQAISGSASQDPTRWFDRGPYAGGPRPGMVGRQPDQRFELRGIWADCRRHRHM
jgi:hypothetical protein